MIINEVSLLLSLFNSFLTSFLLNRIWHTDLRMTEEAHEVSKDIDEVSRSFPPSPLSTPH
jgi:hypothetical protein